MLGLTAHLRADLDPVTQRVSRNRLLREHAARSEADVNAVPKSAKQLFGALPTSTLGYKENVAHYRKFLGAVAAVLDAASSEEVAAAATATFRALQALPPDVEAGRSASPAQPSKLALQRARAWLTTPASAASAAGASAAEASAAAEAASAFRGGLTDDQLKALLASHAPLAAWLRAHRPAGGAPSAASAAGAASLVRDEFGASEVVSQAGRSLLGGPADHGRHLLTVGDGTPIGDVIEAYQRLRQRAAPAAASSSTAPLAAAAPSHSGGAAASASAPAQPAATPAAEGTAGWVREHCRLHKLP